jgi:hypothetical protein
MHVLREIDDRGNEVTVDDDDCAHSWVHLA